MKEYRKPIKNSVIMIGVIFGIVLSMILAMQSYFFYSRAQYQEYDERLENALDYLEHNADADDLQECLKTNQTSQKYVELQSLMNVMIDDFDLFYLYICIPSETKMYSVISATSEAEREAGETDLPLMMESDGYTPAELQKYINAMAREEDSYFEEISDWGDAYTACRPLKTTDGTTIALLCADLEISAIHHEIAKYVLMIGGITFATVFLLCVFLYYWLSKNVTKPITELARSTHEYTEKNRNCESGWVRQYEKPEIHTQNEVEMLAGAIDELTNYIQSYSSGVEYAAAYFAGRSGLSSMENTKAFYSALMVLYEEAKNGTAHFALVRISLNDPSGIIFKYGFERAEDYVSGSAGIMHSVYQNSRLYKLDGGEYAVIVEADDLVHSEELFEKLNREFAEAESDYLREEWKRYSALCVMMDSTSFRDAYSLYDHVEHALLKKKEIQYSQKEGGQI